MMNRARHILLWKVTCLFLLLSMLSGCRSLIDAPPPFPWHECYEPLESLAAEKFVSQALEKAVSIYGEPVVSVQSVLLRHSSKTHKVRNYRLAVNFNLTECLDPEKGLFAIYLAAEPDSEDFYPILGHECFHLLNPYIFDWYMEGAATVFSEEFCRECGVSWAAWEKRFRREGKKKPYSASYWMMKELKQAVPGHYPQIIRYTATSGKKDRLSIDIDAWLDTLSESERIRALNIISRWMKILKRRESKVYHFTVPAELKRKEVSSCR